jgi:hypothetical protein
VQTLRKRGLRSKRPFGKAPVQFFISHLSLEKKRRSEIPRGEQRSMVILCFRKSYATSFGILRIRILVRRSENTKDQAASRTGLNLAPFTLDPVRRQTRSNHFECSAHVGSAYRPPFETVSKTLPATLRQEPSALLTGRDTTTNSNLNVQEF